MTYQTKAHAQQAEIEAIKAEGAAARKEGKPMHHNPYDPVWDFQQEELWNQGWKGAA